MRTTGHAILLLAVMPGALAAQPPAARLVVGGGSATDLRGVRSEALQLGPSVTLFPNPRSFLTLGGRATRYTTAEWSVSAFVTGQGRFRLYGPLALAFDVAGDLTHASYGVTYAVAEVVPALHLRTGPVTLWGGARAAAGRRSYSGSGVLPLESTDRLEVDRSSLGPAFGLTLDLTEGENAARLSVRQEQGQPGDTAITDRVAQASVSRGRFALFGTLGIRTEAAGSYAFGGGRAAVALSRMVSLFAAVESYPANPLLETPGGRAVSVGVVLGGATRVSRPAGPEPRGLPAPGRGLTRLSIRAPDAGRVEVAGDWNQWVPMELARAEEGVWYVDLRIPPGRYRHAFRIDGREWRIPEGVAAVNDGFGGKSAWLLVPRPAQ